MIFARSPQAKGRVERAAATFQDRLVTELRLAGAATITEADELLNSFLPRFNEKFWRTGRAASSCLPSLGAVSVPRSDPVLQTPPQGVQGQHHQVQPAHLATVCPARHVLLTPGCRWRVQEDLEGPAPSAIPRADHSYTGGSAAPRSAEGNRRRPSERLTERTVASTATGGQLGHLLGEIGNRRVGPGLEASQIQGATTQNTHSSPEGLCGRTCNRPGSGGLSLRAIARELSIHRNTARKYALAKSPPLRRISAPTGTPQSGEAEFA